MTSVFFFGPVSAVLGIVAGITVGGRRRPSPREGE
jgi:hypothetical protein